MITDERLDELFRDWARAEVEGTGAPAPGERAEPVDLVPSAAPRRPRRVWLAVAAVALLALSGLTLLVAPTHDNSAPPARPVSDLYGHWVYVPVHQGMDITEDSISFWNWSCALKDTYALAIEPDHLTVGHVVSGGYACTGVPPANAPTSPAVVEEPVRISMKAFREVIFSKPSWRIVGDRLMLTSPTGESIALDR